MHARGLCQQPKRWHDQKMAASTLRRRSTRRRRRRQGSNRSRGQNVRITFGHFWLFAICHDISHTARDSFMSQSISCPLFFIICTVTHGLPTAAPLSMRAPPSPQRRLGASADPASQAALPSQQHSQSASQAHSHAPLPPQRSTSNAAHMGDAGLLAPTNVQGNRLKRTGA